MKDYKCLYNALHIKTLLSLTNILNESPET